MSFEQIVFIVLAVVTLGSAVGVVTARSVFLSALWLILSFVGVAGMYVVLDAGFLAVLQILIYVGAISVLILFTVMLTRQVMGGERQSNRQWYIAAIVALAVFGALGVMVYGADWQLKPGEVLPAGGGVLVAEDAVAEATAVARVQGAIVSTEAGAEEEIVAPGPIVMLGRSLMTDHLLAFEVASVLLLVGLLGAVIVARS